MDSSPIHLTLAHSPDPDDAFMFYALATGQIPTGRYRFNHVLQDIQTLNERAIRQELDITAVSIHAYAHLAPHYALLSSGASMGDGYGPMLVGPRVIEPDRIPSCRIAIPGRLTSAFLALQLFLKRPGDALNLVVVPFDQIFEALREGSADLGLIIHEGQLTYAREGLKLTADLGSWWKEETQGLPLPLGGNAIRRDLGEEVIREVDHILRQSIAHGLKHRQAGVSHALPLGRGLNHEEADRFIGMYVNELTLDYGPRGRQAVRLFLQRGAEAGLIPHVEVQFVGET